MFGGNNLLASISQPMLIPDNRFEKTLQSSRSYILIQGNRLGVFSLHVRQKSIDVNGQQRSAFDPCETAGEPSQKLGKQFPQLCDILNAHETAFRGFRVKRFDTRKVVSF